MQKQLFIHVGFPKTGTTSIQKFFYENKVVSGIEYIDSDEDRYREFWASILYELGNRKGKVLQCGLSNGDCYKISEKYIHQIENSENDKFLISFEGLVFLAKADVEGVLRNCIEKFKDAGVKVSVVLYFRSLHSYWESKYLSDAKSKNVGPFSRWIFDQLNKEASPYEVISYFSEVADDDLVVEYFDSEAVRRRGLVKHFLKALQYPWDRNKVKVSSAEFHNFRKDNVSLSSLRDKKGLPSLESLKEVNREFIGKEVAKNNKMLSDFNDKNRELFYEYFGVVSEDIDVDWIVSVEERLNVKKG